MVKGKSDGAISRGYRNMFDLWTKCVTTEEGGWANERRFEVAVVVLYNFDGI